MEKAAPSNNFHYNNRLQPFANKLRKRMTKAEACLWKYALGKGKMKGYTFRRQRPVLNYIADFMCKELLLVIEVDGFTHDSPEVQEKDRKKDRELRAAGFTVLQFTDEEVLKSIGATAGAIEAWIEENAGSPPLPRRQGKAKRWLPPPEDG